MQLIKGQQKAGAEDNIPSNLQKESHTEILPQDNKQQLVSFNTSKVMSKKSRSRSKKKLGKNSKRANDKNEGSNDEEEGGDSGLKNGGIGKAVTEYEQH